MTNHGEAEPVPAAGGPTDDVIVLDHVAKRFGGFVAVEDACFSIARGEFFSLLGPSGCGKTTILKMIAGFEMPTAGAILLEGTDVSSVPPHKRNVNTVFQQYALFPHMSIVENVAFGLRSKRVPAAEARKRALEMLDVVKLAEYANRRPSQLSGGQQQRVALARSLVNMPAALLLDEPLAALDLKLREAMQLELKRIQRDVGITFVFVTHDQGEALTMSDRIAVMSRGRVEQIGTPEEIYDKPASIFVAGFIGSANLLPAVVSAGSTASAPKVDLAMGATIDVEAVADTAPGGDVTVMLRPERMTPHEGEPLPGRSVVGTIKEVIYQGSRDPSDHRPRSRHGDHRRDRSRRGHRADQGRQPDHAGLDVRGSLRAPGAHGDHRCHGHRLRRGRGDDGGRSSTPTMTRRRDRRRRRRAARRPRSRRSRSIDASSSSAVASPPPGCSAPSRSRASGAAAEEAAAPRARARRRAPGSATVPTR